ncbi:DNA helicase, partial [gut metagenome]
MLFNLILKENRAADVDHPFLQFDFQNSLSEEMLPNFRVGDAIVLYQRNSESDNVTNKLVFKGSIEWITDGSVGIRLRAAQRNVAVLSADSFYAVEHDYMDTAFRSMFQGLAAFLTAMPHRRDILLGQKQPSYDVSLKTAILAETDDFARIALKAKAAEDFFLLVGPPGTGKTSRALRRMVEEFYREGKQLLLLSYTNRAVDEICKMLVAISPAVDFIRIGNELSCEESYRSHLVENVLAGCKNRKQVQERIAACRIFVGTVSTFSSKIDIFRLKTFDVALIDEATQILEPQLLGLLSLRSPAGGNAIGKFVMIGDYKQLPAVILQSAEQSEVCDECLRAIGLRNLKDSLFERLYRSVRRLESEDGFNPFCDMLCRQGRMNVEVADFPNKAFYQGLLKPVGLPHQQGNLSLSDTLKDNKYAPWLIRRVAFFPATAETASQTSKINHSEARITAGLAAAIYQQYVAQNDFCSTKTLGVITPYRSQVALIRREIRSLGIPMLNEILVDTVERFQGSERDVIIYSFCANRVSQLRFLVNLIEEDGKLIDRKLNV